MASVSPLLECYVIRELMTIDFEWEYSLIISYRRLMLMVVIVLNKDRRKNWPKIGVFIYPRMFTNCLDLLAVICCFWVQKFDRVQEGAVHFHISHICLDWYHFFNFWIGKSCEFSLLYFSYPSQLVIIFSLILFRSFKKTIYSCYCLFVQT